MACSLYLFYLLSNKDIPLLSSINYKSQRFWHFIIGFFFSSIYLSKPLFFGIISCYLVYIESELTTDVILNIFLVIIQLIVKFRLNLSTKECCSCLSMTKMLNTGTGVFVIHSNFENGILSLSTTLIVNKLYK